MKRNAKDDMIANLEKSIASYRKDLDAALDKVAEQSGLARKLLDEVTAVRAENRDLQVQLERARRENAERQRLNDAFINLAGRLG